MIEQDADAALALKDHHANRSDEGTTTGARAEKDGFPSPYRESGRQGENGHGRLEIRADGTLSDPEILAYRDPEGKWRGLRGIGVVRAERRMEPQTRKETRAFVLSFSSVQTVATAVRSHGGMEVAFREDESRVRLGHADENRAVRRPLSVNLLPQERSSRVSIHAKRLKAGWDTHSLLRVLDGVNEIRLPCRKSEK